MKKDKRTIIFKKSENLATKKEKLQKVNKLDIRQIVKVIRAWLNK